MNNIQNQFSLLHPVVLDRKRAERVAGQIKMILGDYFKGTDTKSFQVLDIGCSFGLSTTLLARDFGQTIGVDIDQGAISTALKNKQKKLQFKPMDILKNDFQDGIFDLVICHQVYYYLKFSDQQKLLNEIRRVLKNKGVCVFISRNKYSFTFNKDYYPTYYRSFWQLRRLCSKFVVYSYTAKVMRSPRKYSFTKLIPFEKFFKILPERFLEILEPIMPNFIWILQKL